MPSRFIVSCVARAVGMHGHRAGRFEFGQGVGGDRLDFRHDEMRAFSCSISARSGRAVGHVDHVRAVRHLVAGRVRRSGRRR